MPERPAVRCSCITRAGRPCRAWAVRGSDPPVCAAHAGLTAGAGAPPGNQNRLVQGFYSPDPTAVTVDQAIAGLVHKLQRLDELIAREDLDPELLVRLTTLYGQGSSRLARMLRDRRALSGDAAAGVVEAIAVALDELSSLWGVEL